MVIRPRGLNFHVELVCVHVILVVQGFSTEKDLFMLKSKHLIVMCILFRVVDYIIVWFFVSDYLKTTFSIDKIRVKAKLAQKLKDDRKRQDEDEKRKEAMKKKDTSS